MLGIFKDKDKKEGDSITDSLSTILRLLREELEEVGQLIRARSRIDLVELYNKEWQLRLCGVIYIIYIICVIYNRVDRVYIPYRAKGFLRRKVVYLKDHNPYSRQFSFCSKSQNTIRVNLLGNHSTSCYYIIDTLFIPTYLAQ